MAKKNLDLKVLIIKTGISQRELAKKAGFHETTLSAIVNGRINPDEIEKARISKALGISLKDIFVED
jgi:DNA-binding XRE family transcriptional regulator